MNWRRLPGKATDIAVGKDGTVWVLGTNHIGSDGDYEAYRWSGQAWVATGGGGIRIAVADRGNAWVVNTKDQIYRYHRRSWQRMPGLAKDIGNGPGISVIGTNPVGGRGNFGVFSWDNNRGQWISRVGAGGTNISGGFFPVITTAGGDILEFRPGVLGRRLEGWVKLDGKAKDVGLGPFGLFVVGTEKVANTKDFVICRMTGNGWVSTGGGGKRVAAGPQRGANRGVWVVNTADEIYQGTD